MGKRAAAAPAADVSKARKEPKLTAPPAPTDPFLEEISPLLELLGEGGDGHEMLQAVIPHCLRNAKEERHAYQSAMIDVLEKVLLDIELQHKGTVEATQQSLAEAEAAQESSAATLRETNDKVKEREEAKVEMDKTLHELEASADEKSKQLAESQANEKSLEVERMETLHKKDECQKFRVEKWEPLKSGSFTGKEWRERNKVIDVALQALDEMGMDASLKSCLPTALKTKPAERGRFAQKAIEFTEIVMSRFQESTEQKIAGFDQEAVSRATATAAAKEVLHASEAELTKGQAAVKEAKDALTDANIAQSNAQVTHDAAPETVERCKAAMESDTKSLSHVQEILSMFMALKDKSRPTEPPKEDQVLQQEEVVTAVPAM
eukprot:TRINITY_DN13921_c0_g1_i1.p1 TRINITY_DN13921_c0_g1~~TRINITY_DN13921_c0_g1_i1.p1  ORF type:complete len:401 (-),score=131.88 TRINITY_DN13921_c0_g1_i1:207-1340(-)